MKAGNLLILTQWSFNDALVQTYTLPYVRMIRNVLDPGKRIYLVTAEHEGLALDKEELKNLNAEWASANMQLLALPYRRFGIRKLVAAAGQLFSLYRLIRKEKISQVHAFCTPAGALGYILSLLTGAALVIDSYEPHAESMVENGTWKKNGSAFRILFSLEKKLTRKAGALIATTGGMRDYALEKYGCRIDEFYVKPACVDLEQFSLREKDPGLTESLGLRDKIVCVYAGKLGGIYFKQEVFDFIHACYKHWGERFRFLLLTNASPEEIGHELSRTSVPETVVISRFVKHEEIPSYLSLGDFALNPVKPVPTKRYCTSIKDGEYWAMGLPVVISPGISDDSEIITSNQIGVVLDFTDKSAYEKSIGQIEELIRKKEELKTRIRDTALRYRSFHIAEEVYKKLYGNHPE